MVDLPTVSNGIVTSAAPTSAITPGVIEKTANDRAAALDKVAGVAMDVSTELAKKQAAEDLINQKVTRDADGNVSVATPENSLIFGVAGEAYHKAVQVGTVAANSNIVNEGLNNLHQEYQNDPQGFKAASDAYLQKHAENLGGEVGAAILREGQQLQAQHFNSITNAAGKLDLQTQSAAMSATQTSARDDATVMVRGGASLDDPALKAKVDQFDAAVAQRQANPLFAYPPEQAQLDREQFQAGLAANRLLYNVDKVYKDQGPNGGKNAAIRTAEDILTNPSYKLSEAEREQYYHKAVGEIRANEAIRKQDIGEARAAYSELTLASAAGARIESDQVEQVAGAFRAAGDPGSAARVYSSFIRKPLNDDFGRQPLAAQTQQLTALQGANAAAAAHAFFIGKGYSPEQAAGIVGNLVHESGVNPYASGDGGTSGGLAQFHNERLAALRTYAASVGKPATDFQTQLEFIDKELNSTEGATRAKLMAAKTPEQAAAAFIDYERPAGWTPENPAGGLGFQSRQSLARGVFNGRPGDMSMGPAGSAWLAANRQRSVDDAASTQWKTVMADYAKEGTKPSMQTVNDVVNAARATRNADLLDTIAHDAERMDLSGEFGRSPLPAQHAQITGMSAAGESGNLPPGTAALMKDLQRKNAAITKGLDDNPIATAATNFPDKIKPPAPLDFSSDQNLAAGMKARGQVAQFAAQNWQTGPLSALDSADVAQVQGMLANPDPAVKGRVFNALSALPEDVRNATLAKIGSGRPDLMVSVAAGSMMRAAPDVASSIIRGQQAIAMDKGYAPEKGAEATAFDQKFNEAIPASTFSLAARTDATGPYAVAQGMVKARYADLSAQSADTSGKFNPDRMTQAVNDVTGGILDHNGGKLIAPVRGMPQATFDRTMYGITDADLGHGAAPNNFAAANAALKLTPEEQALYQRHLTNLYGTGGVTNANGSRSTLFQASFEQNGRTYNVPTVYDGKILPVEAAIDRARQEGLDKFPSYGSEAEAEARYNKMHDFMEKDTAQYNKGNPQAVTTLSGQPVTANYLRNNATLESVGDGRYFVKLGKDPLKPVYAYQGANTEAPAKFMLDLRNRRLGALPPVTAVASP